MDEFDLSFFEDGKPLPPNDPTQRESELEMLKELASNVGNYDYEYTDEAKQDSMIAAPEGEYIGIMAQDLLKIPGLASAVISAVDENGGQTYKVDGNRLALSAMGYIAALSKIVLDMRGIEYENTGTTDANTISDSGASELNTGGTTSAGGDTTNLSEENGSPESSTVQTEPTDVYAAATRG